MDRDNPEDINFSRSSVGKKIPLDEVLSRSYDYSISELIASGWSKVSGLKLSCIIYLIIIIGASLILPEGLTFIFSWIIIPILSAGFYTQGIKHYKNQPIEVNDLFSCFSLALPIILFSLVSNILIGVGFLLLILPGIYLSVGYMLTVLIIINNPKISFWDAMELSRKVITLRWWKNFGLILVLGIILIISVLPFGIGLIWTLPLSIMTMVNLYDRIFGLAES